MKVKELFEISYPSTLIYNQQTKSIGNEKGVPFVSSKGSYNGVVGFVQSNPAITLYPSEAITVPLKGTVLQAFVQDEDFYCAHQIAVLVPRKNIQMSLKEKLYYCLCVRNNKYKYSYGRQADKTLGDIELPDKLPNWISSFNIQKYREVITTSNKRKPMPFDTSEWKPFRMDVIFNFSKGKRLTKDDMIEGELNYIGAISDNNGIRQFIDAAPTHKGNCITVNYNGSVGEAFYQKDDFWASDDVNVLTLKSSCLNTEKALFLCTIIKANKFRFSFGRKWTLEKMKETILWLPVNQQKQPAWGFMEQYIKQLPYADKI